MPDHRNKREAAKIILTTLLAEHDEIPIAEAVAAGRQHHLSRKTLERAAAELGIQTVRRGPQTGLWRRERAET